MTIKQPGNPKITANKTKDITGVGLDTIATIIT